MLKPGDTFDRYTIDAVIGQGGMGSVYRAHDARLDRRVAVKLIADAAAEGSDAPARLVREARAAAALDHPNVVSIFDVGEISGAPYVVMELVSGRTLREVVADASVPLATRAGWLADVARALSAAHRRGLVHRDVKPENVMVRDDGVVKVLDFGIARRASAQVDAAATTQAPGQTPSLPTLTQEGVKLGTPAYMSPEQIRGDPIDGRADQFAWGSLAFEVLTGRPPWRGNEPLAMVASILTDDPPAEPLRAAGVPPALEAVVRRALSKRVEDRFPSMDALLQALAEKEEGAPARAGEATAGGASPVVDRRGAPPPSSAPPDRRARVPVAQPGPAARSTLLQRYSTEEVQEILSRAVEQQAAERPDTRLGFDDLLAAAEEVGVEPEVLRQASRDLRARQDAAGEAAAHDTWIRRKRRKFYRHAGVWAIVNVALLIIGLLEHNPGGTLTLAVLWGIGLAIQGLRAFTADEDDWREEREKEDRKRRKKMRRARAIDRALDEGAEAILKAGETLRQRVAVPTPQGAQAPAPVARVRVAAVDVERERAAEEEAAAEERARGRRRG